MAGKIESGNSFNFVGMVECNPQSFKEFKGSNYTIASIKLSIRCGNNYHFLECTGFKPNDPNKKIKYFYTDKTKGEVSFANRMEIDTEHLAFMHPSINTSDDSQSIRFISDYDYVLHLHEMAKKNFFNDVNKYRVSGDIAYENYFNKDGKLVEIVKYRPTKFEKVDNETECISKGLFNIYLGDNCFEKVGNVGVLKGKSVIRNKNKDYNGIEGYEGYDTKIIVPLGNTETDRVFSIYKKRYNGNDKAMGRIGIHAEIINGAEEIEFDESMLTDDEKFLIENNLETIESIKASKGIGKGDFVRENVRINEAKGYGDGSKESALNINDLDIYIKDNVKTIPKIAKTDNRSIPIEMSGSEAFDDLF